MASACVEQEQLQQLVLLPAVVRDSALAASCRRSGARLRRRRGCGTGDHHRLWLNVDPCGATCASLVWAIMLYSQFVVSADVILPWLGASLAGAAHLLLFNGIAVLALVCHARTMLSNPGAVPRTARPTEPEGWARECSKCRNFKPARAHHCSICGRCGACWPRPRRAEPRGAATRTLAFALRLARPRALAAVVLPRVPRVRTARAR